MEGPVGPLKMIFIMVLAFFFVFLFGVDSINMFFEKGTVIEIATVYGDLIDSPALTVCNSGFWGKTSKEERVL